MDANILLSLVNTKLRNNYDSLESLCEEEGLSIKALTEKLLRIDYQYDEKQNQFKPKK